MSGIKIFIVKEQMVQYIGDLLVSFYFLLYRMIKVSVMYYLLEDKGWGLVGLVLFIQIDVYVEG